MFLTAAHLADTFLPERGGTGDPTGFNLWSSRAGLAFWTLVALWLVSLVLILIRTVQGMVGKATFSGALNGMGAVAVLLPPIGFIAGEIALFMS